MKNCKVQPHKRREPVDGGFGWVIVGASFLSLIIVDGIIFSFGVFFGEIESYYHETKQKTALIGSLLSGFYLLVGPAVSALANRYTCRKVTICGTLVASFGFVLSVFAPSVNILCLTYGVIIGIGFGMIYLPAIVMVGMYFNQKRALATGIAVSGSSIGTFIFAPLSKFLIDDYGWRGAILIIAGIVLHCIAAGLLFCPVEEYVPCYTPENDSEVAESLLQNKISNGSPYNTDVNSYEMKSLPKEIEIREYSMNGDSSGFCVQKQNNEKRLLRGYNTVAEKTSPYCHKRSDSIKKKSKAEKKLEQQFKKRIMKPFYRNDVFLSQNSLTLVDISNIQHHNYNFDRIKHVVGEQWASEQETICGCLKIPADSAHVLKNMLDISLLKSQTFILLCISAFLTFLGLFVPFTFIVDYSESCGHDKGKATTLISVIGATNTVGRILSGWMSDKLENKALFLNNIALTLGGIAICVCPFVTNYIIICICVGVFGLAVATFASLRSIILVELLGLEKLSNAFGLNILFMGVACILGPPFAGYVYDITNSYHASFTIAGSVMALSGLIAFPLPQLRAWELKREKAANNLATFKELAVCEPV